MWSEAIPSALGAAIYPPALLFTAFLLASPGARSRALIFLAGAIVVTLGVGFAVVLLLQGTGLESRQHRSVPPWIDLALGLLLVLFAVVVYLRPPKGPKAAKKRREIGLIGLFGIGVFMYSPSPFYLASLHAISKSHPTGLGIVVGVVVVAAIYMLLIEIPIVAHALWPQDTVRKVTAVNGWLARHGRTIVIVAAAGFGVYLLSTATAHLIS